MIFLSHKQARTYKHAFSSVNVLEIGVSRFLATARRLERLKRACGRGKDRGVTNGQLIYGKVIGLRIITSKAQESGMVSACKSTRDVQDRDHVTADQLAGIVPLNWLSFRFKSAEGGADEWRSETQLSPAAICMYLNSEAFDVRVFPLPGHVQVVTGGPPCQGWTGFNPQRVLSKDIDDLASDQQSNLHIPAILAYLLVPRLRSAGA